MTALRPRLAGEIPAPARPSIPILRKGFRPFFFLAALWAVAILPVWMLILAGIGHLDVDAQLGESTWHAHELLFGFVSAVIAGFLLTAVGNWTGRETATGPWLAGLCALWIAGRVAVVVPISHPIARAIDLAFIPALAITIARPLVLAKNVRNFVMLAILAAYWVADLAVWSLEWRTRGLRLTVDVVVLLIAILTGRIVPMFTRNGTGVESIRSIPILDKLATLALVVMTILDVATSNTYAHVIAYAVAAVLVFARTFHWGTFHALRVPMLWILHAGHTFLGIGLLLRALPVVYPLISDSSATHCFTVGAIGCTTLGMMARVSLGHTGRPIAAKKPIVVAFAAMVVAAIVRVAGPHWITLYAPALFLAGTLWTIAFLAFLVVYTPFLFSARVDGKAG